jgi:hypothetical protein
MKEHFIIIPISIFHKMTSLLFLSTALDFFMRPFSGGIMGLIWVLVLAIVLRNIWKSSRKETNKLLWSAIVFFFPIGGVILWWVFGD